MQQDEGPVLDIISASSERYSGPYKCGEDNHHVPKCERLHSEVLVTTFILRDAKYSLAPSLGGSTYLPGR